MDELDKPNYKVTLFLIQVGCCSRTNTAGALHTPHTE